jgi:mRNA interferase MazF
VTKGKVVLVSFPFDDLSSSKVRPAVCLTDPVGIHRHVVLAFITSRMPEELLDSDLVIGPGGADFQKTGLRAASVLRLHRLLTVSTSTIRREIGVLSPGLKAAVRDRLRRLFGI